MSIPLPDGAGTPEVINEIEDQPESNKTDPLVDDILSEENVEGSTVEFPNVPEITQMGNDFPGFFATLAKHLSLIHI